MTWVKQEANSSGFIKKVTSYYIELRPENPYNSDRYKERINLRKASRVIICNECHEEIKSNEEYIRDKFFWRDPYKKTVNNVCLKCWKGETPNKISTNWKKSKIIE